MGKLDAGKTVNYTIKSNVNGVYAFILSGNVTINGQELADRDGYGMWNIEQIEIKSNSNSEILLMEVPMTV
jgi:redox-sensitive bicupin YhaK (pirin superfamily)